jgi:hypothetical protein
MPQCTAASPYRRGDGVRNRGQIADLVAWVVGWQAGLLLR